MKWATFSGQVYWFLNFQSIQYIKSDGQWRLENILSVIILAWLENRFTQKIVNTFILYLIKDADTKWLSRSLTVICLWLPYHMIISIKNPRHGFLLVCCDDPACHPILQAYSKMCHATSSNLLCSLQDLFGAELLRTRTETPFDWVVTMPQISCKEEVFQLSFLR